MVSEASVTKQIPIVVIPWVGLMPFDWLYVPFVIAAMLMGWLARMARLHSKRSGWEEIRYDLITSALVGGAIACIAAGIIHYFDLSYIEALLLMLFLTYGGIETMEMGWAMSKKIWFAITDRKLKDGE